jgi:transposase-like protein
VSDANVVKLRQPGSFADPLAELLLDWQDRGLVVAPKRAVADGALGVRKALGELWPTTREQRCWVHAPPRRQSISLRVR